MNNYKIITENTVDMPQEYIEQYHIGLMSLSYTINNKTYGVENQLDWKTFYKQMRAGHMPVTSQINPEEAKSYLIEYAKESKQILYIGFSSALSGSYNSVCIAARELMEEDPELNIVTIDSKSASMGEGLLLHKAVMLRENGSTIREAQEWLEKNLLNIVQVFTVDDLNHLCRGGRVSKTTAIVGSLAGIKPILHIDNEGKLIPIDKIRGRKKALMGLVDYMEEKLGSHRGENDTVFISHGDAYDDAIFVRDEVKRRFGVEDCIINHMGPTIGAHAGPGTVTLFFMGDER